MQKREILTEKIIADFITESVKINSGFEVKDRNKNLFYNVDAALMLYVAADIKTEYELDLQELFKKEDYTVMNINNLAEAIYKLLVTTTADQ